MFRGFGRLVVMMKASVAAVLVVLISEVSAGVAVKSSLHAPTAPEYVKTYGTSTASSF